MKFYAKHQRNTNTIAINNEFEKFFKQKKKIFLQTFKNCVTMVEEIWQHTRNDTRNYSTK